MAGNGSPAVPAEIAAVSDEEGCLNESHEAKETCDTPPALVNPSPNDAQSPDSTGSIAGTFSPLVRLAGQITDATPAGPTAAATEQAVEPSEILAVIDEPQTTEPVESPLEIAITSEIEVVLPTDVQHSGQELSPLVKLADQIAGATRTATVATQASVSGEIGIFGDEQRAKNVCANLPAAPDSSPADIPPDGSGPRLPGTPENPRGPLENKLFDPNLLDEPPLDLETRIRNSAPPQQFAPTEFIEAPRPLPITPLVAIKAPVVDSNRRFLDATVPGDISTTGRPFLRDEELAINSEPGPFSQIHLGEKLTLDFGGIAFGMIFDDNFTVTNGNRKADTLLTIGSGLALTLGSTESRLMVRANYNASGVFFLNHSNQNSFDQSLSFDVDYRMQRLTLGLHIRPSLITGSSLDAGDRVGRKVFYSGLTANYTISEKTSISLNADYTYAGYNGLLTSREARVQAFLNYQILPKITLGLGGGYGVLDVDGGQTQTSEQALVQATYAATAKLTLNANAGWDFRNGGNGVPTSSTPVFSLGAAWAAREKTTISVDARRRTYGSAALVGQNYEATGFSATISQQLRPKVNANLTVGYEFTEYQQALIGVDASRKDNYFFARVGMGFPINRWCSGNVFYEFSNNSSTGNGARSFDRNRVGLFVSYKF